jgi:hypothetical protein
MRSIHELLRLATRIRAAYEQRAAQSLQERQADWYQLEYRVQQAQQQRHRLEKARMRTGRGAGGRIGERCFWRRACDTATDR